MLENLHKCDISYCRVINLESRFITDILPSDTARPRGQYISYKPPSRFITLTNNMDKINQSVSTYHMSVAGVMVSKLTISGATTKRNDGWLG